MNTSTEMRSCVFAKIEKLKHQGKYKGIIPKEPFRLLAARLYVESACVEPDLWPDNGTSQGCIDDVDHTGWAYVLHWLAQCIDGSFREAFSDVQVCTATPGYAESRLITVLLPNSWVC